MSASRLSPEELERYARHIVLPEIGGAGQQRLKNACVLVVGAGGLGSPILQYLAAAGVGTLGIVDDDCVSLSNLQRQVIHDTNQIGQTKTASAAASLRRINPHIRVDQHELRIDAANAEALVSGYDVVADACDNVDTRYVLADACAAARVPLVHGAITRFDGSLTVFTPYDAAPDGSPLPSYRDLYPTPPPADMIPTCAETGVLGVLPGVIGTLQASEVLKLLLGLGEPLIGRLLLFDALSARFDTIRYHAKSAP